MKVGAVDRILVINAGSSSIKAAVFGAGLDECARVEATGIGGRGLVRMTSGEAEPRELRDQAAALAAVFAALETQGIGIETLGAAGHRVVHGGDRFTASAVITPDVRDGIEACNRLAPLHNPHNLAAIDAVSALAPGLPQVAVFDTAFHATNPEVARAYAIPARPETEGIRRYGFHGTSFAAMTHTLPERTGAALPSRLLALHLGNGASLCAIRDGQSVATTMGYSPVSGLTMGTRSGDIDATAVLEIARRAGIDGAAHLLNHESGLLGLSGLSHDMRTLDAADTPAAKFAIEHFCYWAVRHSGSMIAAMGGVDAIAFTGGIGENAAGVRARIVDGLAWAGPVPVHVVPAEEERHIARDTLACVSEGMAHGA